MPNASSKTQQQHSNSKMTKATRHTLEFKGSTKEFFNIWLVNTCLTILTLGMYSAWAKVKTKKFFYENTYLDGSPFEFLATPKQILIGRFIAVFLIIDLVLSLRINILIFLISLAAIVIIMPWLKLRSLKLHIQNTTHRKHFFNFKGGYFGVFTWFFLAPTLPFFLIAFLAFILTPASAENLTIFSQDGITTLISFLKENQLGPIIGATIFILYSLFYPFLSAKQTKFFLESLQFQKFRFRFNGHPNDFFSIFIRTSLIAIAGSMFAFLCSIVVPPYIAAFIGALFLIVTYAYHESQILNLKLCRTKIGNLRLISRYKFLPLASIYLTNALAIFFSLGLLTPWALVRTHRYFLKHLSVMSLRDNQPNTSPKTVRTPNPPHSNRTVSQAIGF